MKHLLASVKAIGSDDEFPGMFEAIASTTALDRDGEVVAKGALEPLPATVPIHVDHRMDSEGLVGTGRPSYTANGALKVTGTFAGTPRAQIIRQLVREGHLSSMSVGFSTPRSVTSTMFRQSSEPSCSKSHSSPWPPTAKPAFSSHAITSTGF
jgi:phage head maturation protease